MVDIFSIFLLETEIYCLDRFQKLSLLTNRIFCDIFWNNLPNQMRNSDRKYKEEIG